METSFRVKPFFISLSFFALLFLAWAGISKADSVAPAPKDWETSSSPTQNTALPQTPASPQIPANNPEPGNPNAEPTPEQAKALGLTSKSLVPCTDNCNLCDLVLGIKRIFDYLMTLLAIVATLFIVIAGIAYIVSAGNKNLMDWAKKALMYALIGLALYLCSWLIVSSILTAMGYNRTGWSTFDCETSSGSGN
jgi:hypothetical protein